MNTIPNRKEDGYLFLTPGFKIPFWIIDKNLVARAKLKDGNYLVVAQNKDTLIFSNGICTDKDLSYSVYRSLLDHYVEIE